MTSFLEGVLVEVCRVEGVRGALLVSADDGLVVAESAMDGLDAGPVAALAASLAGRLAGTTTALGEPPPTLIALEATDGGLVVATGDVGLLLVAVTDPDANAGMLRLALLDAIGRLA